MADGEQFAGSTGQAKRRRRAELAERNALIVASLNRGMGTGLVARRHDLTPRMVQKIRARAEAVEALTVTGEEQQRNVVRDLAAVRQLVEDYAEVFEETDHTGWRLGALRGRMEAIALLMNVQAAAGQIPRNLAAPNVHAEVMALLGEVVETLRRHHVAEEVVRELLTIAERRDGRPAIEAQAVAA
jgi:hypothetical protein